MKQKSNKSRKKSTLTLIILFSVLGLIFISIPSLFFYYKFGENSFSSNLTEWGLFGDFIGGTTNTIISLISLIVLGLLTFNLHSNSVKEAKNLFILQNQLKAYDALMINYVKLKKNELDFKQAKTELETNEKSLFLDHHGIFIKNFTSRYNHFFDGKLENDIHNKMNKIFESILIFIEMARTEKIEKENTNNISSDEPDLQVKKFIDNYEAYNKLFSEYTDYVNDLIKIN